jgi:signal transduction histidine kinase
VLEADQQAAESMLQDVEFGVLPHLESIDATLTKCAVGGEAKAAVLLGQIRDEIRLLSSGLGLRVLGDSIDAALFGLLDGCGIPAHLEAEPIALSSTDQIAIFMIASEAVANAVKHSAATHLVVSLHPLVDAVQLTVTDDGCGGAELRPGGGLTGISDRISALGGTLTVEAREGGGTVVTARLPWQPD